MSGSEYVRIANFGFVNSRRVCVSLYYLGLVIDTMCYDPSSQLSPVVFSSTSLSTGGVLTGNTTS